MSVGCACACAFAVDAVLGLSHPACAVCSLVFLSCFHVVVLYVVFACKIHCKTLNSAASRRIVVVQAAPTASSMVVKPADIPFTPNGTAQGTKSRHESGSLFTPVIKPGVVPFSPLSSRGLHGMNQRSPVHNGLNQLTPGNEHALTFMTPGSALPSGSVVHAQRRHAARAPMRVRYRNAPLTFFAASLLFQ